MKFKPTRNDIKLYLKGFAMGTADVVPGVSGGTIALISGIYDELVKTVGSFDHKFLKILLSFNLKEIFKAANGRFLVPLGIGIISSILLMARVMHFLLDNYPIYTWSLFFGLILASIIYILKTVEEVRHPLNIVSLVLGTIIGYLVVTLLPVETPETFFAVFLAGFIGICAMILPGISGSFILLILGKYYFITSMLKNPFAGDHLIYILTFCSGCAVGLLSFSKFIDFLLQKFHGVTMCILIGFMVGSLRKIWPWKHIEDSIVIRGKVKVLTDSTYLPTEINSEVLIATFVMLIGFISVFLIEKLGEKA